MTALYFVDANIFVYAMNESEPAKQGVASALLQKLWLEQSGCTSIQAINEFYSVVTRKVSRTVSREAAWDVVEDLLDWNGLQPLDPALVKLSRSIEDRYKLNWWDCQIVAAALMQGCSVLYTEDMQHGAVYEGVRVSNPFKAHVQETAAPYRIEPVSRHRPRGRPRKQAAIP